jgi:hypothetical protein
VHIEKCPDTTQEQALKLAKARMTLPNIIWHYQFKCGYQLILEEGQL